MPVPTKPPVKRWWEEEEEKKPWWRREQPPKLIPEMVGIPKPPSIKPAEPPKKEPLGFEWWKEEELPRVVTEKELQQILPLSERVAVQKQYQYLSEGEYMRRLTKEELLPYEPPIEKEPVYEEEEVIKPPAKMAPEERAKQEEDIEAQVQEAIASANAEWEKFMTRYPIDPRTDPYIRESEWQAFRQAETIYKERLANIGVGKQKALEELETIATLTGQSEEIWTFLLEGKVDDVLGRIPSYRPNLQWYLGYLRETLPFEEDEKERAKIEELIESIEGELKLFEDIERHPREYLPPEEAFARLSYWEKVKTTWGAAPLWTKIVFPIGGIGALTSPHYKKLEWWHEHVDVPFAAMVYETYISPPELGETREFTLTAMIERYKERPAEGWSLVEWANPIYWIPVAGVIGKGKSLLTKAGIPGARYLGVSSRGVPKEVPIKVTVSEVAGFPVKEIVLPRPRSTQAILEDLKMLYPERFKTKTAELVALKEAKNVLLETSEIGQNYVAVFTANLNRFGEWERLLTIERNPLSPMHGIVRSPYIIAKEKGLPMTYWDIAQNPSKYIFKGTEGVNLRNYITIDAAMWEAQLKLAKDFKIPVKTLLDEGEQFIGRVVAGRVMKGKLFTRPYTLASRIGVKIAAEKPRLFKTAQDAIDKGYRYLPAPQAHALRLQQIYNRIAGEQAKEILKVLTKTPAERVSEGMKAKYLALGGAVAKARYAEKTFQSLIPRKGALKRTVLSGNVLKKIERDFPDLAQRYKLLPPKEIERISSIRAIVKEIQAIRMKAESNYKAFASTYRKAKERAMRQAYTEGRVAQLPAFANRIFEDVLDANGAVIKPGWEVARMVERMFAEQVNPALTLFSKFARVPVTMIAAIDWSWSFIQGQPVLARDIARTLTGHPSAIWAKGVKGMIASVIDPKNLEKCRVENAAIYARYPQVITSLSEFYAGVSPMAKAVARVPIAGKYLERVIVETYGRFGAGFTAGGEVSRINLIKGLESAWLKEASTTELQQFTNLVTGVVSSRGLGVSARQRALESALLFAPRYLRANLMLIRHVFRGTYTARQAQILMGQLAGSMIGTYAALCYALGQEPKFNPLPKSAGGDGYKFMSIRIGQTDYGLPGWWYSFVRFLFAVGAAAVKHPDQLIALDMSNPSVRIGFSKASPTVNLVKELITGRDFLGRKLDDIPDYIGIFAEKMLPIFAQSVVTQDPRGEWHSVFGEWLGFRTVPEPAYGRRDMLREKYAFKEYELIWDELDRRQKRELEQKYPDLAHWVEEAKKAYAEWGTELQERLGEYFEETDELRQERIRGMKEVIQGFHHYTELHKRLESNQITPDSLDADTLKKAEKPGTWFRERLQDINSEYANKMEQLGEDYPEVTEYLDQPKDDDDAKPINDVAYLEWLEMISLAPDLYDEFGDFKYSLYRQRVEEFKSKWGDEIHRWVQDELHRDFPEMVLEYYKAQDVLKPYREVRATLEASGQYPKDKEQQEEWVIREMARTQPHAARIYQTVLELKETDPARYALIRKSREGGDLFGWADRLKEQIPTVDAILNKKHKQMRRDNPKMDAYLVLFYDRAPILEQ